jgi:catechol 2,3-dioxygenase-like lactoylglutathione lyase family enzyme
MLDHVSTYATDFDATRRIYTAALAPLGSRVQMELVTASAPDFPTRRLCAFGPTRPAGARDNGAPGLRPQYPPHDFGAFVLDPDGNNVEAVCHTPEG